MKLVEPTEFQVAVFNRDDFYFLGLLTSLDMLKDVLISKGSLMTIITFPTPADADAFLDLYLDLFN